MPKFITTKNTLTQYALTCGYLETNKGYNCSPHQISLERDSACYHVKVWSKYHGRELWESFDLVDYKGAWKRFQRILKDYGYTRKIPN